MSGIRRSAKISLVILIGILAMASCSGKACTSLGRRAAGVSRGDWWKVIVDFTWFVAPHEDQVYDLVGKIEWVRLVILDVSEANVTFSVLSHFVNGTEAYSDAWLDVETGHFGGSDSYGVPPYALVAANLTEGESLYTEEFPYRYLTVSAIQFRTYVGETIRVDYLCLTYYGYQVEVCYANEKGILCEANLRHADYAVHALITESSTDPAIPEFSSSLLLTLLMLISLFAAIFQGPNGRRKIHIGRRRYAGDALCCGVDRTHSMIH